MDDMDEFFGKKYVMVGQEYFDEYLSFLGHGFMFRKMASSLKPIHSLLRNDDDTYTFTFESFIANGSFSFKLDEEFEEKLPGWNVAKSIITFVNNRMIHKQTTDKGQVSVHVREFFPDKMITTTTAEGFNKTVKRYYDVVTR